MDDQLVGTEVEEGSRSGVAGKGRVDDVLDSESPAPVVGGGGCSSHASAGRLNFTPSTESEEVGAVVSGP